MSAKPFSRAKCKLVKLSIAQKVELLRRLEKGTPARQLQDEYGVGSSTIYDIKKHKAKLMKYYENSDAPILMTKRKTMLQAKNLAVDKVLYEWFRQRRSEGVTVTGVMLVNQAKVFHKELNITQPCYYSKGWLQKFKLRHGIQNFTKPSEPDNADSETALKYIDEFSKLVSDENISPVQIYNADETGLYWQCLPHDSNAPSSDDAMTLDVEKERMTVLACSNAAGTHKCKLLVVGTTMYPDAFDGIKIFPVNYCASENAWITPNIVVDWFENHFVPEARAHCKTMGLDDSCKIILILDNCSAHPDAEVLAKENVFVIFIPPNCTSLLQPMDQGITRCLKYFYRAAVMKRILNTCTDSASVEVFRKKYNIKDAVWALARAWDEVTPDILKNAWYNLWPAFIFDESDIRPEMDNTSHEKKLVSDLLDHAKRTDSAVAKEWRESQLMFWMNIDCNAPVVQQLSNREIINLALNKEKDKVSIDECIKLTGDLINALKQRSFISEEDIGHVARIKEILVQEKPKYDKHLNIQDIFKKISHNGPIKITCSPDYSFSVPSTSSNPDSTVTSTSPSSPN